MYTGTRFWLVTKSMTLNDLWARFEVIYSLNAAIIAKYSLVMTPTLCRVAGCIISIRPTYSCAGALTYLFTYLHSLLGEYKAGKISETVKIERKLLLTAYIKSYTSFRLPPKRMTLNDLWACEIRCHWFPKCRKKWGNTQLSSLMTQRPVDSQLPFVSPKK